MSSYPTKPWTDGQTHELIPGELFEFDSDNGTWVHLPKTVQDSDFQVEKAALQAADTALDNRITNLSIPVISATQPTGQTGLLWVNLNDGKLYYWNDSDAFVSIVTS